MRCYCVAEFGEPLHKVDQPTPHPKGSEALVRVSHCGVCHTDVHLWHGYYNLGGGKKLELSGRGVKPPFTPGHEVFGEIVSVGSDAPESAIGRRGVVFPWVGCGNCKFCHEGDDHLCATPRFLGVFSPGGYGDHVIVPSTRHVVEMPGVDPALAATYACSGLTAFGALAKARPFGADAPLVLIGAGGVGLTAVALLVAESAIGYTVVDIDDGKLDLARSLGAPATVNARSPDAGDQIASAGAPATVIDFVGSEETATLALGVLRKGGTYIVVGLYGGELKIPLPSIPLRVLRIQGSYVGNLATFEELAALVSTGRVPAIPVERRAWHRCTETLEALEAGQINGRVVLEIGDGE